MGKTTIVKRTVISMPTCPLGKGEGFPALPGISPYFDFLHRCYPYPLQEDFTDKKKTVNYRAVILENDYLRAVILPDLGGKVFQLYDKAGKVHLFFHPRIIVPRRIAVRGAWIAGGLEFNFPDSHSVTTFDTVDSAIRRLDDGSASVTVGNLERTQSMRWQAEIILRPGAARLEVKIRCENPTPLAQKEFYWSNAGISAGESTRFIYPMRRFMYHGGNNPKDSWPLSKEGVDLSFFKNIRNAASIFALDSWAPFFAACNGRKDYAILHSADEKCAPGKKIFTFGTTSHGKEWNRRLGGPYAELQSGNVNAQTDYAVMRPGEVQQWVEYWYGVKHLKGLVSANDGFAFNCKDKYLFLYSPLPMRNVTAILEDEKGTLLRKVTLLEPARVRRLPLNRKLRGKWRMRLLDAGNKVIFAYNHPPTPRPLPKKIAPMRFSKKRLAEMSARELIERGGHLERIGTHGTVPKKLYEKAMKRKKPVGAYALGVWYLRRGNDKKASRYLAVAKKPEGALLEPRYLKALCLKREDRLRAAKKILSRLVKGKRPPIEACTLLAEIHLQQGKPGEVLKLLARKKNVLRDSRNAFLYSAALRLSGAKEEARDFVTNYIEKNPVALALIAEADILRVSFKDWKETPSGALRRRLKADAFLLLQIAQFYMDIGRRREAEALLKKFSRKNPPALVLYHRAYLAEKTGDYARARRILKRAARSDIDALFPHGWLAGKVLRWVLNRTPRDFLAKELLATLMYAGGDAREMARLLENRKRFSGSGLGEMLLGLYHLRTSRNFHLAEYYLKRALQKRRKLWFVYYLLNEVYVALRKNRERLKLFASAPPEVTKRDEIASAHAIALIEAGKPLAAYRMIMSRKFQPSEFYNFRACYELACMTLAQKAFSENHLENAQLWAQRGLLYPKNLGSGKRANPPDAGFRLLLARIYQARGRQAKSRRALKALCRTIQKDAWNEDQYFRAKALELLGENRRAKALYKRAQKACNNQRRECEGVGDNFSISEIYFNAALAEKGLGNPQKARYFLRSAMRLNPGHHPARWHYNNIEV